MLMEIRAYAKTQQSLDKLPQGCASERHLKEGQSLHADPFSPSATRHQEHFDTRAFSSNGLAEFRLWSEQSSAVSTPQGRATTYILRVGV